MSLRPIADRVLVQYDEPTTQSAGGLYLPAEYRWEGRVLAVGPGARDAKGVLHPVTEVQPGDRVLLDPGKGVKLIDRAEDRLLMLRAAEIVAVVEA